MIVDDEQSMRNLLLIALGTQGYDVLEAPNGKIALDLLQQEPKLIILDLGLPDVAGHDLLGKIQVCHESVPIVVLSSRVDSQTNPWNYPESQSRRPILDAISKLCKSAVRYIWLRDLHIARYRKADCRLFRNERKNESGMKSVEPRPFADPEAAARKIVELANAFEPVQAAASISRR
jgi:CheY-like chemotaxis protein